MSNAVDMLIIGGPHDGIILCQPLPVPAVILHEGIDYTSAIRGGVYRVFLRQTDADDDGSIDVAIAAAGLQPSWDLTRW